MVAWSSYGQGTGSWVLWVGRGWTKRRVLKNFDVILEDTQACGEAELL